MEPEEGRSDQGTLCGRNSRLTLTTGLGGVVLGWVGGRCAGLGGWALCRELAPVAGVCCGERSSQADRSRGGRDRCLGSQPEPACLRETGQTESVGHPAWD